MGPEAHNSKEQQKEQPSPKLDQIDAKLDGAQTAKDVDDAAHNLSDTGTKNAEQTAQNERKSVVRLAGLTKDHFEELAKRGFRLPKIPGLPDAAQLKVEDLKTGAQAVKSAEIVRGTVDAANTAKEGIKKTVHTMRGGTIEDLQRAGKVAAGAAVDTVRAGVEPAATKAAGAIGEKKGRDATPNLPIFGDAAKEQAGKLGRVVGEQGAKSTLDALAARAKDAMNKPIDNAQDVFKNRQPEKAREGVERTKQQELRELIGKYHQSKNEKVQKDFDALFANLEPQRAQAMINVYKTMNPQEQQRFIVKMRTDADVFAKMTPQGRERCARLLAATPEEREQMIHSLPKEDLAAVRNLYRKDREGWNAMTEFYNRTDALASGQVRDAARSARASNAKTLEHDEAASGNVPHVRSGVRPNFDALNGNEHIAKGDEGAGRKDGVAVGRMESRPAIVSQVKRVSHEQKAGGHGHEQKKETANPKLMQEVQDLLGKYGERVKNAVSKISTATLQTIMEAKERSPALSIALDKILTKGSDTFAKLSESGVTFMTKFLFESADQIQSEFSSLSQADQQTIVGLVKSIPDDDIGILPKERVAAILNFEKQRKQN